MSRRTNIPLLIFLAAVVVLAVGYYLFINSTTFRQTEEPAITADSTTEDLENLSGYIYISDREGGTDRSIMKVYNIGAQEVSLLSDDGWTYYRSPVPYITSDGLSGVAYLQAPYEPNDEFFFPHKDYLQLTSISEEGDIEMLSNFQFAGQRSLSWSDEAKAFVFSGISSEATQNQDKLGPNNFGNWSVYTINTEGNLKELIGGISPVWSRDGSLIYFLRENGLYSYDVITEDINRVITNSNWNIPRRSSVILNTDESMVVFADTDIGKNGFHIYDLSTRGTEGQKSNYLGFFETIDGNRPLTLISSPQSEYFAYLASGDDIGTIYIYNLETHVQTKLPNLQLSAEHSVLSAWSSERF